jgi:hypothetical protein
MRQYHVIPKTGTPAVGPLSAEQVVDLSFLRAAQAKVGMYKRSE